MAISYKQGIPSQQAKLLEACADIQKDELFALQSIYLNDFEFTRSSHPYQFSILVKPFVPPETFAHHNFVFARIIIELPLEYPLGKQLVQFEVEGLTNHFSRELTKQATELCDNYISSKEKESADKEYGEASQPIVFGLVELLREWCYDQCVNQHELNEQQKQITVIDSLSFAPMPKFSTYTQCTAETFLQWKKKFDQEIYDAKKRQKNFSQEEEFLTKMTGKMYFEKSREKGQDVEEEFNDEDAVEVEEDDYESKEDQEEDDQPKRLYQMEYE